jgi:hypothetical protein
MKIVEGENETVIYPLLAQNDTEFDDEFCIMVGNSCTMINNRIVDEDDLPKIIEGIEKALEILL